MSGPGGAAPRERGGTSYRSLVLHVKAPLPGFAKSRLIDVRRGLDAEFVARLSHAFFCDTLDHARAARHDELVLHFTPEGSARYFRNLHASARLESQVDAPFGARLQTAFSKCFDRGPRVVVLVGMDTPHLPTSLIDRAFDALLTHDVVLGPARDGGYYLLGMRERRDSLFTNIDWSTGVVAAQTRERAAECGATLCDLDSLFDVDLPDDLAALRALIAKDPLLCPRTAQLLAELESHGESPR